MFSQISKKLTKISSIKLTVFSFLLFLFFMFVVLPSLASKAAELFAGLGSPDLLFSYSSEKLYEVASTYGELGRNAYIETRFQFDLVWPVVYTLFLVTSISWFCSRITNVQSKLRYCNLLPIVAVVFDLLENTFSINCNVSIPCKNCFIQQCCIICHYIKMDFCLCKLFSIGYFYGYISVGIY